MDVSIVIVNWNVRELLAACLRSLNTSRTPHNYEIIVVDNNSSDGSVEYIQKQFPAVNLIALKENVGFARANNQAIKRAQGRYVFILNPDCEVFADTLAQAVRFMDEHPSVALLAPRIENADHTFQRGSVRSDPTLWSQLLVLLKLQRLILLLNVPSNYYQAAFNPDREQDIEQAMGAALFVRRSALDAVGLFDELFFLWFEEVDLCKRLRTSGYSIRFSPAVRVIHHGGQSFSQRAPLARQLIYNKSLVRYFFKHRGVLAAAVILVVMPLNFMATLLYQIFASAYASTHRTK